MRLKLYFIHFFILVYSVFCVAKAADLGIECTVFDVGQGSGAVIIDKQRGKSFIVDCGEGAQDDNRVRPFNNYVFGTGSRLVDLAGVVLSHSDSDHVKLLTRSIGKERQKYRDQNRSPTRRMTAYLGSPFDGYCVADSDGEKVLGALLDVGAKIIPLSHVILPDKVSEKRVDIFDVRPYFLNATIPEFSEPARNLSLIIAATNAMHEGEGTFLVGGDLAGAVKKADTALGGGTNDNSAIVKLSYAGKSILFPGDVDGKGTDRLVDSAFQIYPPASKPEQAKCFLKADVLVAAHHGAETNGTNNLKFLLHANPDYAVISAGEHLGHVHPRFEILFSLATILKSKPTTAVVPYHFVQCGTRQDYFVPYSEIMHSMFCLEVGSVVTEIASGDRCVWKKMKTSLPIYTTPTNGDIKIIISSAGVITVTSSR